VRGALQLDLQEETVWSALDHLADAHLIEHRLTPPAATTTFSGRPLLQRIGSQTGLNLPAGRPVSATAVPGPRNSEDDRKRQEEEKDRKRQEEEKWERQRREERDRQFREAEERKQREWEKDRQERLREIERRKTGP